MVVKFPNAFVAHAAVFSSRARGFYVAQMTSRVLDYVTMLRPIEFWDNPVRLVLPAELRVGGVQEKCCQMRDNVHCKEQRQECPDVLAERCLEGGNDHEKGGQTEDEDREPADDLLRVQRQLQAVNPPATTKIRGVSVLEGGAQEAAASVLTRGRCRWSSTTVGLYEHVIVIFRSRFWRFTYLCEALFVFN